MLEFYCIPTCSTCKAAKKWLQKYQFEFEEINLKTAPPDEEKWIQIFQHSDLPLKRFFNTSGMVYKERGLKDVVPNLTEHEAAELLASEGMLIKRPLILEGNNSLIGFKEAVYEELLQKERESVVNGK
ncbi:Spx/MgsR family RNA polymerase-binding regulatory protein [Desemzia sp. RIT804]|uniref:Spx/MgsR family RNA polymerase-binding regulatory protein n=1 Tax=Desemzia sp. RIT 804 TaxID=2810209 RepID=UPI00194FCF4D|nr:Spx/MgsR family RNA polymerase-binding regulatory protein [Desemzia sp. RIT 804]MBM6615732.1 Spx/MgsR family RNA polymerase-binding regulatory protein [Desemzia sp. RIT 804]